MNLAFQYLRHDEISFTLLGFAAVILVAHLAGRLFVRFRQPPVVGEMVVGLMLGPSVLGGASHALFPDESRPLLKILATLGLVVFMFLIGLELDLSHLSRQRNRIACGVAFSGTVVPFGLGLLLASVLYGSHHRGVEFVPFALFIGASMSVTAFPVLARVLVERGLYDKPLGVVAMACAAGDDVLTWATLALVLAIVSSTAFLDLPYICTMTIAFGGLMLILVRPQLTRFRNRRLDSSVLAAVVVGILVSSFVTSTIGIHEIFGAFLFGAVFPRGQLAHEVRDRMQPFALVLLPLFFVTTGLNVDIGDLGPNGIGQFALILAVACLGKLLGAIVGARPQGLPMREAVGLGVLMNTRGLTELIVLNVGWSRGIIDDTLFTLLTLMAVVTTVATGPLLRMVNPDPWLNQAVEPAPGGLPTVLSAAGLR